MNALRNAPTKAKLRGTVSRRDFPLQNRHFLLVEEPPDRRRLSLQLLEDAGAEVTLERHALTGVVVALSMPERFDALILDVSRPLLEIAEAGIALRSAGFDRPIIALVPAAPGQGKRSLQHAGCAIIQKSSALASTLVEMVAGFLPATPALLN